MSSLTFARLYATPVRRLVRQAAHSLGANWLVVGVVFTAPPAMADEPCADVEVVFARGTFETPGIGETGEVFVDALHPRLTGRTIGVQDVDYPASLDFGRVADGVGDALSKIQTIAASCPTADIVVGGYSQGAAVAGYVTADSVPAGYELPPQIGGLLAPSTTAHIAAVVLFAKPSADFLHLVYPAAPPIVIGRYLRDKTIELCDAEDPVCSPTGHERQAHSSYKDNGMAAEAADTVVHDVGARHPKSNVEKDRP